MVRVVEEVEHEYFMSYQDGLITVCLRHLTEQQKLQILRLIIEQTKGKILEDVPMQLPQKQDEEKFLRICYVKNTVNILQMKNRFICPILIDKN